MWANDIGMQLKLLHKQHFSSRSSEWANWRNTCSLIKVVDTSCVHFYFLFLINWDHSHACSKILKSKLARLDVEELICKRHMTWLVLQKHHSNHNHIGPQDEKRSLLSLFSLSNLQDHLMNHKIACCYKKTMFVT